MIHCRLPFRSLVDGLRKRGDRSQPSMQIKLLAKLSFVAQPDYIFGSTLNDACPLKAWREFSRSSWGNFPMLIWERRLAVITTIATALALLNERHLVQMCQVLRGKLGVVDHRIDLGAKGVEGALERRGDGPKRR